MSRFEYAPAPESRAIVDIKSSYGLFVNGQFTDATDGKPFKTVSLASEEVLAEVSDVFRETHLERDRSFGKLTWTFDGRVDVTGGAERFGDEQLAALLGGRPLGRDVATIEQQAGAPVADTTGLGLTVVLPGGTTEHWDVRLDQTAPLPVHAEGSVERGAARLWAAP